MLKFILLVVVFFLVLRMAIRFFTVSVVRNKSDADSVRSHTNRQIEDADYEVIDSRLGEKEADGSKGV
ncbi:MAG: hypothetical protein HGA72_07585 [Chlorobiaceae bacterium]|jgi:hypothetical protein|nr:hypothetical protein [Chlorobiaceae bacterium]NTW63360.1 hypothetical protein [Chlorobiaceae bacterium]